MNPVHIDTLIKMRIGQIKEHEKLMKEFQQKHGDLIDRERETVASYIEQNKIKKQWAQDFVDELDGDKQ